MVSKLVERCSRTDVDIACLSEAWMNGFCRQNHLNQLQRIAENLSIYLVAGGLWEKVGNKKIISCPLIAPDGHILGRQLKTHLFRNEKNRFMPGTNYKIFTTKLGKVGVAICHDIVFPEVPRILTLMGAGIIFNPSRIQREGIRPWRFYARARALENRVPFVAVNHLDGGRQGSYNGMSVILQPYVSHPGIVEVEEVAALTDKPGIMHAKLDLARSGLLRSERLRERKPETYSRLISRHSPAH